MSSLHGVLNWYVFTFIFAFLRSRVNDVSNIDVGWSDGNVKIVKFSLPFNIVVGWSDHNNLL